MPASRVSLLLVAYLTVGTVAFAQNSGSLSSSPSDDYLRRGGSVRPNAQTESKQEVGPNVAEGRVVLASGEKLIEPVLIRRVCASDRGYPVGYTDSKGNFRFKLVSLGMLTSECSLIAEVPGFRSDSLPLLGLRSVARNDAVSSFSRITLNPLPGQKGGFTSITSLAVPNKAKSALEKALKEYADKPRDNVEKVVSGLETAVSIYPEYAAAWSILGAIRLDAGNMFGGEAALKEAMRIDPDYLRPYEPLIGIRITQRDWNQVDELADYVLAITPTDPTMLWYKALASFRTDRHDETISFIEKIRQEEDADKQFPQTHQVLGMIHAGRSRFQQASAEFRRYLELVPAAESREAIERQLTEWKQLGFI